MATMHHTLLPDLPPHWSPVCVSRLHFHVTWFTRGRREVLTEESVSTMRTILESLAEELGVRLDAIAVLPGRVHVLLSLRPSDCAGSIVRELKGRSALELLARRPELRVRLGGNLVWSETYGIATVSPANLEKRKLRLERIQQGVQLSESNVPSCSRP